LEIQNDFSLKKHLIGLEKPENYFFLAKGRVFYCVKLFYKNIR